MTVPLFVYWEGAVPRWIEVCLNSLRQLPGVDFHLVTPENVQDYIPGNLIPANLSQLQWPSHRSDFYRAALLHLHGGFYFDADTVGLKNPEHLVDTNRLVYSVWEAAPRRVIGGYLFSPGETQLTGQWLEMATWKITHTPTNELGWTALVEEILTPMLNDSNSTQVPRTTFMPVDIDSHWKALPSDGNPDDWIRPESVCFGLHHSMLMNEHREAMLSDERGLTARCWC